MVIRNCLIASASVLSAPINTKSAKSLAICVASSTAGGLIVVLVVSINFTAMFSFPTSVTSDFAIF